MIACIVIWVAATVLFAVFVQMQLSRITRVLGGLVADLEENEKALAEISAKTARLHVPLEAWKG